MSAARELGRVLGAVFVASAAAYGFFNAILVIAGARWC